MTIHKFEKEFRIHVYEIGPDSRLTQSSLFDYFQDIASDHAIELGFGRDDLMKENHFWVLSRMYAEINIVPSWQEKIIIKTWPNGIDKLFAMRNFEVFYPDGRHIASASSSWLIVDNTTRKICRPDNHLAGFVPGSIENEVPVKNPGKLEFTAVNKNTKPSFRVKHSDIDVNLHTNNVRYLKWVTDTYSLDFIMTHSPYSVEINYIAESRYDEEIIINTSIENTGSNIFDHSIIRTNDNKELCRIRLGWKDVPIEKS
jgi:medium-chain acyl-[acyl-carrier-protein] hydrolase